MALDILLINPCSHALVHQELRSCLAAIEVPVWAGMLASFARQHGLTVDVLDANALDLSPEAVAEEVRSIRPALVVLVIYGQNPSASTMIMGPAGQICTAIKNTCDRKILMVGGHVAALPERTLTEEGVHYVCYGEGFNTVVELARAIRSGTSVLEVPDLVLLQDGRVLRTNSAPLIDDLDRYLPAYDLLPMDRYRAHNWHCLDRLNARTPYASIYTTLGCPFTCSFCCIHAPFRSGEVALAMRQPSYRYFSPRAVVSAIDTLVERYGISNMKFSDELFVVNKKHVLDICRPLAERGYNLNVWAYTRIDSVEPELLDIMRAAGIKWLATGIESGDKRIRDAANKSIDDSKIYAAVAAMRESGISVLGNFLFGLPQDDRESMRATLDLATDLNCEFVNFNCVMAYPGSRLYDQMAGKAGLIPQSWEGYAQHSPDCFPLPTDHLSGREVLEFRDEAFNIYFSSRRYLSMIEAKFGPAARSHIERMTSIRMIRNRCGASSRKGAASGSAG